MIGYLVFEGATNDPEVVLPANAGIKAVEVDYQHTPSSGFASSNVEHLLNLWGEGPADGYLINQSGVPIQWHNLTSIKDPKVGLIGHSETHAWYQLHAVDAGTALPPTSTPAATVVSTAVALASPAPRTNPSSGITASVSIGKPRGAARLSRAAVLSFWESVGDIFD